MTLVKLHRTLPIKSLFLMDTIAGDTTGTEKQVLALIAHLDRRFIHVHVACLYQSDWMQTADLPVPVITLGYRGFLKPGFPIVVTRLARLMDQFGFDVVHTFLEESPFVALAARPLTRSKPLLVTSRRDIGLGRKHHPWYHHLFRKAMPWVNNHVDGIVANSQEVRSFAARRERSPEKKYTVIYNGVSLPSPPRAMPQPLESLMTGGIKIAVVASLTPVKRHDLLLDCLRILSAKRSLRPFSVICMGNGPLLGSLVQSARAKRVDHLIQFAGTVKPVDEWLHYMHVGLICSDREGLSNAVLEYMAASLPVVATAVGGNPELVDDKNGFCVPPGNADALAHALERLIMDDHLRRQMGRASGVKIQRSFSWQRCTAELELYYRNLMATHRMKTHGSR